MKGFQNVAKSLTLESPSEDILNGPHDVAGFLEFLRGTSLEQCVQPCRSNAAQLENWKLYSMYYCFMTLMI